jgi:hypothetical protein
MTFYHDLNNNLKSVRDIVEKIYDEFPQNIEKSITDVKNTMIHDAEFNKTQVENIVGFINSLKKPLSLVQDPWNQFMEMQRVSLKDDLGFQAGLHFLNCPGNWGINYPEDIELLKQATNLYAIQQYVKIILSAEELDETKCSDLHKDIRNHMLAYWICIKGKREDKSKNKVIGQYLMVVFMNKPKEPRIELSDCGINRDIIDTLNNAIQDKVQMKEYKTFGMDTLRVSPSLSHLYFPFQNLLNNIEILKNKLNPKITSIETIPKYLLYIRLFENPDKNGYIWKVTDAALFKTHVKKKTMLNEEDIDLQKIFELPTEKLSASNFGTYVNTNKIFINTAINDLFEPETWKRRIINEGTFKYINDNKILETVNKNRVPKDKYPNIPPFQFQDLNSLKSDPTALAKQLFHREIDVSEICGITGNGIVYVQDPTYGY